MRYILISLVQTAGVILLAGFGVFLGRWISRRRSPSWLVGYIIPLLLVIIIGIPRWSPQIETVPPFSWIMADRMEFAVMAPAITILLTTPLSRLRQRRQRYAVFVFMVLFVIYFSVLPFLMPVFAYSQLSRLETTIDQNGVCLQSNGYNCGPATAVAVLRKIGVPAGEGQLALRAHTTRFAGTPTDSLCAAIRSCYGIPCRIIYCRTVDEIRGKEPLIALVKFSFMVDHFVAVLSVTDTEIILGDPLEGIRTCTHKEFEKEWRKCVIVLEKNAVLPAHKINGRIGTE
jgi:predicted double-glycine peptidase